LGIFSSGEQHALVARGFFFFAHAAGLGFCGRGVDGVAGGFVGGGGYVGFSLGLGLFGGLGFGFGEGGGGVLAAGADIVIDSFAVVYARVRLIDWL
jgi:hypothetical protein